METLRYPLREWLPDIEVEYLGGVARTTLPYMKQSMFANLLDPSNRKERQAAAVEYEAYADRLEMLLVARKELSEKMDGFKAHWKRETKWSDEHDPSTMGDDIRKLEIAIDSTQNRMDELNAQIRALRELIHEGNKTPLDELSYRANLGLAQFSELRKYLAQAEAKYRLIQAFKQFELDCDDDEAYFQVLGMMIKRFELGNMLPEWESIFLCPPEERGDYIRRWPGGFKNLAAAGTVPYDPEPHRMRASLKEYFENLDDSMLEETLGVSNGRAT